MKFLNDDLIVFVIILSASILSFLLYLAKFLGPGKPVLNLVSLKSKAIFLKE